VSVKDSKQKVEYRGGERDRGAEEVREAFWEREKGNDWEVSQWAQSKENQGPQRLAKETGKLGGQPEKGEEKMASQRRRGADFPPPALQGRTHPA